MQSEKIIVNHIMGKILCNKQEKNQNKLNFDLDKMQLNYRKSCKNF